MYNIPSGKITYKDIEKFCLEEHEEDLILDYKIDWPNDLSRIISGMANVQGGMIVIGVGTQEGSRKPTWPPPGVDGTDDSLHQRVIQISYDAIYPPVIPQIDIVRFADNNDRAIVVIRIDASRLLHAIDQRRKVYIRVSDQSRGVINDLANLSQLEWLFQQRQMSVEFRDALLKRTENRASIHHSSNKPTLTFSLLPVFPSKQHLRNPSDLIKFAKKLNIISSRSEQRRDICVPRRSDWRTTSDGGFVIPYEKAICPQYLEVGSHGLVFLKQSIVQKESKEKSGIEEPIEVKASIILLYCDAFLKFATKFIMGINWHGSLLLLATLINMENVILDHRSYNEPSYLVDVQADSYSQDNTIIICEGEHQTSLIEGAIDGILEDITCRIMWAFGYPDTREELEARTAELLK